MNFSEFSFSISGVENFQVCLIEGLKIGRNNRQMLLLLYSGNTSSFLVGGKIVHGHATLGTWILNER